MTDIDPALREALVKQMWGHRVHVVTPHDAHRVADYLAPFIANAVKAAETAALAERDAERAEVARLRAAVEGVRRVVVGQHPMPYCERDGRIVVDLLARLRKALAATEDQP